MTQRMEWRLIGVAAALLTGVATTTAAVQGRDRVCWLGTEDWQLCEEAGGVYLVRSRWDKDIRVPKDESRRWHVSAPTIRCESGKFLASGPKGPDPTVRVVADQGDHAQWTFEIVSQLRPEPSKERGIEEGGSGFTFRVRMAGGPFRGWYLAAGEVAGGQGERKAGETAWRTLRLVRSAREATVFT